VSVPEGAIVTPLARDEADRLGVELVGGESAGGPAPFAASRSPATARVERHRATCDPDELERVIERVRARVPGADPGQVREIARRVLERGDG
jgi:hypothetical protein